MTENRVIGIENRLPWNIPEDLKRFKQITSGHPVVMGRKTFESIGRVLPNRTNLIITRSRDFRVQGAVTCSSLEEALKWAGESPGGEEVFVIGGGEIFHAAMAIANRIYLTIVEWPFEGDAYFPPFDQGSFQEVRSERIAESPPATLHILERTAIKQPWEVK